MKIKEFVITLVLAIFMLIVLSGLHFRIVTNGEKTSGGWYDKCDTVELHHFKIEVNESDEFQDITCFNKFHVWFAW